MKNEEYLVKWVRIVLGVFLIGYALNQFFHILPSGYGQMQEPARSFIDSIVMYLPMLYIFEIIIGICLVLGRWLSLIIIMLIPLSGSFLMFIVVNGDFVEMWPALIVATLNLYLLISRRDKYIPLLD